LSRSRHAICTLACGLAAATPVFADAWCDVMFKDVAHEAQVVVLARVERAKGAPAVLRVDEVLKDESGHQVSVLPSEALEGHQVKHGDRVLVALDGDHRLVRVTRSLGGCAAISVLPIRGGKLRARDRVNYDSREGAITLDRIRQQLLDDFADDSRRARCSGR
jgi:hypothetical protein